MRALACAHAGAYLKLLQKEAVADLSKFDNTARYTIMFGALDELLHYYLFCYYYIYCSSILYYYYVYYIRLYCYVYTK